MLKAKELADLRFEDFVAFPFPLEKLGQGRAGTLVEVGVHHRYVETAVRLLELWLHGDPGLRFGLWLFGRFSDDRKISFLRRIAVSSGYCIRTAE